MRIAVLLAALICIVIAYSKYQHKHDDTYLQN